MGKSTRDGGADPWTRSLLLRLPSRVETGAITIFVKKFSPLFRLGDGARLKTRAGDSNCLHGCHALIIKPIRRHGNVYF